MSKKPMTKWERGYLANVLYDEDVGKIWFNLGNLRIDGKQLHAVALLIKENKIKCFKNVSKSFLGNRTAQYRFHTNELYLSPQMTPSKLDTIMESIILHEGVHALIDLKKAKETTSLHNEAAAYVAQALFLRSKKTKWPDDVKNDPIVQAVEALIKKFNMTRNKAWLQWVHFEPLMKAIQNHSIYRMKDGSKIPWNTKTPADGIARAGSPDGLVNNRAVAAKQRGPMGIDAGQANDGSRMRGPLGIA